MFTVAISFVSDVAYTRVFPCQSFAGLRSLAEIPRPLAVLGLLLEFDFVSFQFVVSCS